MSGKKRRDTFIERAIERAGQGWVVGFQDEVWWSRLKQPAMHAWSEEKEPLRLVELSVSKQDPDPKALCCYGLLRDDTRKVMLRFVDAKDEGAARFYERYGFRRFEDRPHSLYMPMLEIEGLG
ncbi:MAG: hypothetical protein ABIO92_04130 [Chloroflexia bacterium]